MIVIKFAAIVEVAAPGCVLHGRTPLVQLYTAHVRVAGFDEAIPGCDRSVVTCGLAPIDHTQHGSLFSTQSQTRH